MDKITKLDPRKFHVKVVHGAKYGGFTDDGPADTAIPVGDHYAELVHRSFNGVDAGQYIRIIDANHLTGGDLWLPIAKYPELGSFPLIGSPDSLVVVDPVQDTSA